MPPSYTGPGEVVTTSSAGTDEVFGTSGAETVVWAIASEGGVSTFHNGASATGALFTLGDGENLSFPNGAVFSDGLYVVTAASTLGTAVINQ